MDAPEVQAYQSGQLHTEGESVPTGHVPWDTIKSAEKYSCKKGWLRGNRSSSGAPDNDAGCLKLA